MQSIPSGVNNIEFDNYTGIFTKSMPEIFAVVTNAMHEFEAISLSSVKLDEYNEFRLAGHCSTPKRWPHGRASTPPVIGRGAPVVPG